MKRTLHGGLGIACLAAAFVTLQALPQAPRVAAAEQGPQAQDGLVHVAVLNYGRGAVAQCFADHFLADAREQTHIRTAERLREVHADSGELFEHPFAILSGQRAFTLPEGQVEGLRRYLLNGGFILASAGCSAEPWNASFRREMARVLPDMELERLELSHPIFRSVREITELKGRRPGADPALYAVRVDGRIAMIYSPDGLNDTANAGDRCCCCGGNEIRNAREVNLNILAYALTH